MNYRCYQHRYYHSGSKWRLEYKHWSCTPHSPSLQDCNFAIRCSLLWYSGHLLRWEGLIPQQRCRLFRTFLVERESSPCAEIQFRVIYRTLVEERGSYPSAEMQFSVIFRTLVEERGFYASAEMQITVIFRTLVKKRGVLYLCRESV